MTPLMAVLVWPTSSRTVQTPRPGAPSPLVAPDEQVRRKLSPPPGKRHEHPRRAHSHSHSRSSTANAERLAGSWLTGLPPQSLVERQIDSGGADIRHPSQSLRSPANAMCAGEAHPATLLLAITAAPAKQSQSG